MQASVAVSCGGCMRGPGPGKQLCGCSLWSASCGRRVSQRQGQPPCLPALAGGEVSVAVGVEAHAAAAAHRPDAAAHAHVHLRAAAVLDRQRRACGVEGLPVQHVYGGRGLADRAHRDKAGPFAGASKLLLQDSGSLDGAI
eukprot:NODE_3992_length_616_cov_326.684303_g2869_i0.p2 GENE.NODE_3992_length_616_cov_326.684303_g2869_i0~~NODE_3992_length_616_cov_326.684303_g2869_i0.p2  ORF type:complete len:165 (+),score=60.04 NODE_3992_length_616_cov_326.684303_g2869_i0:74-496(+)